jgi:hypothetical protein
VSREAGKNILIGGRCRIDLGGLYVIQETLGNRAVNRKRNDGHDAEGRNARFLLAPNGRVVFLAQDWDEKVSRAELVKYLNSISLQSWGLIDRRGRHYHVREKKLNSLMGMQSYQEVRRILCDATKKLSVLDTLPD